MQRKRSSSVVISGHQWSSVIIRGHQRPSAVIRGHQRLSEVIRGHRRSSEVITWKYARASGCSGRCSERRASRIKVIPTSIDGSEDHAYLQTKGQPSSSVVISGHQCSSVLISAHQCSSQAIAGHQRQSEALKPTGTSDYTEARRRCRRRSQRDRTSRVARRPARRGAAAWPDSR